MFKVPLIPNQWLQSVAISAAEVTTVSW